MNVKRISMLTQVENTKDLPVTQEQLDAYDSGEMTMEKAMPQLSAAQRAFMRTGTVWSEWEAKERWEEHEEEDRETPW